MDLGELTLKEYVKLPENMQKLTISWQEQNKEKALFFFREAFWNYQIDLAKASDSQALEMYAVETVKEWVKRKANSKNKILITDIRERNVVIEEESFYDDTNIIKISIIYSCRPLGNIDKQGVRERHKPVIFRDIFTMKRHAYNKYAGLQCKNCGDILDQNGKCTSCGSINFHPSFDGWRLTKIEEDDIFEL